jgi:hypothetical protein
MSILGRAHVVPDPVGANWMVVTNCWVSLHRLSRRPTDYMKYGLAHRAR